MKLSINRHHEYENKPPGKIPPARFTACSSHTSRRSDPTVRAARCGHPHAAIRIGASRQRRHENHCEPHPQGHRLCPAMGRMEGLHQRLLAGRAAQPAQPRLLAILDAELLVPRRGARRFAPQRGPAEQADLSGRRHPGSRPDLDDGHLLELGLLDSLRGNHPALGCNTSRCGRRIRGRWRGLEKHHARHFQPVVSHPVQGRIRPERPHRPLP